MRTYETLDMLMNCLGAFIGTIIVSFIKTYKLKSK